MNLCDFLIPENTKVIDAMRILNISAKKILFVTDHRRLLASISDGDIRRWILRKGSLEEEVKYVANYHPRALQYIDRQLAKKVMIENSVDALPILNDNGDIIDIKFINEFEKEKSSFSQLPVDVPVVIMAGGKGTRLYPYTQILPKPLLPINEKTITEHIMDRFEKYGCENFSMIVNYKKELIKAFFADSKRNITFYDEENFLGTGGGLRLLAGDMTTTFFMTNCDILIEDDYTEIYKVHKKNGNLITVVSALKNEVIPYGVIDTNEKGEILKINEKPTFDFLVNTGLYVVEPEFINEIAPDTFTNITDTIQKCISKKIKVGVYPIMENSWMDMGQMEELDNMRCRINEIESGTASHINA